MGCKFKYNGQTYESEADLKAVLRQELKANTAKVRDGDKQTTIYSKLGTKTVSGNVVVKNVYQQEGVQYAKSIGGIFSLRINNSNTHFGNPFSPVQAEIDKGLIVVKSTKEAVENYIDWLTTEKYDYYHPLRMMDNDNFSDFYNKVKEQSNSNDKNEQERYANSVLYDMYERKKWILAQLKSGNLKGKPIVYYKELGEPSHATALDYLINKYDWDTQPTTNTTVKSGVEISSNAKGLAAALTNPTELAKYKGNLTQSYPITFKGKTYKDSEEAYQALKSTATKDDGPNNTYNLMVDIIKAKLEQHPRLITEITNQGGSAWVLSSTHQPTRQNSVWETGGKNWFIKALNDAYIAVTPSTIQQPKTVDIERNFVELENNILDFEPKVQKLFNAPTVELYDEVIGNYEYDLSADIDNNLRKDIESKLRDVKKSFTVTKPQQKITDAEVEAMTEALVEMYPEIKLNITNNPIWEKGDNVFNQEEYNNQVNYRLKATEILLSDKAEQLFKTLEKNKITGDTFWKKIQELGIPKKQIELLKSFNTTNREELITQMLANYSYTVEINTGKSISSNIEYISDAGEDGKGLYVVVDPQDSGPITSFQTREEAENFVKKELVNSSNFYSNLTVPGGTNYTENEISTPLITPSIKGHGQFATDKGIGWFRSDDKHAFTGFLEDLIASGTIKKVPCG